MKKKNMFLNKEEVHAAFVDWKTAIEKAKLEGKPKPKISNFLAKTMMDYVEHFSRQRSFSNYSWLEDMKGQTIVNMVDRAEMYDITRLDANPFAFFQSIAFTTFIDIIAKEKQKIYAVKKHRLMTVPIDVIVDGGVDTNNDLLSSEVGTLTYDIYLNDMRDVLEYDKKLEMKRQKVKESQADTTPKKRRAPRMELF